MHVRFLDLRGVLHFLVGLGELLVELLDGLDFQEDVLELALVAVGPVARVQQGVDALRQLLFQAGNVRYLLPVELVLLVAAQGRLRVPTVVLVYVVVVVEVVGGDLDQVVLRVVMSLVVDAHLGQGALHGLLELDGHLVRRELALVLLLLYHGVILLLVFLLFLM